MKVLKQFLGLIGLLLPFALVVMLWRIYSPEDLSDIEGRSLSTSPPADLAALATMALDAGMPFECREEELNAYLASVVKAREGEGFDLVTEFKGLWIRLGREEFELIFERDVLGLGSTVAVTFQFERQERGHALTATGGRFGQMTVPRGALNLLRSELQQLGEVMGAEKDVLSRTGRLTISPGRLRLEPSTFRG